MWGGVKTNSIPCMTQDGSYSRRYRAFTVGSGDMDDWETVLRIIEAMKSLDDGL
jgi:hypothetical protein